MGSGDRRSFRSSRYAVGLVGLVTAAGLVLVAVPGHAAAPVTTAAAKCHGIAATIVGTAASNEIQGTSHRDIIVGLGGNDDIEARGGNDLVCGGPGSDEIEGDAGRDTLRGGAGNDDLEGDRGNDRLFGGFGFDTAEGDQGADICRAERVQSC